MYPFFNSEINVVSTAIRYICVTNNRGIFGECFIFKTADQAPNYVSECWRFYAMSTARVIFTAKTSLDLFSLSREQVWTFSSLG